MKKQWWTLANTGDQGLLEVVKSCQVWPTNKQKKKPLHASNDKGAKRVHSYNAWEASNASPCVPRMALHFYKILV